MDVKEILKHVDHTLLKQTATWEDIKQICDDGIKYGCASVCIPQTYVNHAAHYVAEQQHYGFGQLPICTVIGFPNGYTPSGIKCMEAESAVADGATEIDMVIQFEKWEDDKFYDRLGLDENDTTILDVPVPQITIPVSAGRNLAAIVELAAMNNRQKKHGFNSAREFAAQIDGHIDRVTRENEAKKQNP